MSQPPTASGLARGFSQGGEKLSWRGSLATVGRPLANTLKMIKNYSEPGCRGCLYCLKIPKIPRKNAERLLKTKRILIIKMSANEGPASTFSLPRGRLASLPRQLRHWPLDSTQLVVSVGLGWSRHTCIPTGFMYYRDHFICKTVSLIESYLTLSYMLP